MAYIWCHVPKTDNKQSNKKKKYIFGMEKFDKKPLQWHVRVVLKLEDINF